MRIKKIEAIWNAHTPTYLHPYTKENLVWQLKLTGVVIIGVVAYEAWTEHQMRKNDKTLHIVATQND